MADLEEALNEAMLLGHRQVLKDALGDLLGVDIQRVLRYLGDPSTYAMTTGQGEVTIGPFANIFSQTRFREIVGDMTGVVIPKVSAKAWEKRVQAIRKLAEDTEARDASHPAQEARRWMVDYLIDRGVRDNKEWKVAARARYPYRSERWISVFLEDFTRWLEVNRSVTLTSHQGGRKMRQIGAELDKVNIHIGTTRTSRSCWVLPEGFQAEPSTGRERARREAREREEEGE